MAALEKRSFMKPVKWHLFFITFLSLTLIFPFAGTAQAGAVPVVQVSDFWRTGVQLDTGLPVYSASIGRARSAVGQFKTSVGTDSYYVVGAPSRMMVVRYALARVLARSGSYAGSASLALEIHNMNGDLVKTVTSAALDLQAAPTTAWMILQLNLNDKNGVFYPGQVLVYHFHLDGAANGDLNVQTLFEAAVSDQPLSIYLPITQR
jgi:hypothetical protein